MISWFEVYHVVYFGDVVVRAPLNKIYCGIRDGVIELDQTVDLVFDRETNNPASTAKKTCWIAAAIRFIVGSWTDHVLLDSFEVEQGGSVDEEKNNLLNKGLYTPAEAARLIRQPVPTIRRWAFGYQRAGKNHAPLFDREFMGDESLQSLSFLDLVELFLIDKFIKHGVPTEQIRAAAKNAAKELGKRHPFATMRFGAVGKRVVFLDDDGLVDAMDLQNEMLQIVEQHLRFFDFEFEEVRRWWPLGPEHSIVLDPRRMFGAPTIRGRVAVQTILDYLQAGESATVVADLFGLDDSEIQDAILWQHQLEQAA